MHVIKQKENIKHSTADMYIRLNGFTCAGIFQLKLYEIEKKLNQITIYIRNLVSLFLLASKISIYLFSLLENNFYLVLNNQTLMKPHEFQVGQKVYDLANLPIYMSLFQRTDFPSL